LTHDASLLTTPLPRNTLMCMRAMMLSTPPASFSHTREIAAMPATPRVGDFDAIAVKH